MSDWTQTTLDNVVELRRGFDLPHGQRRAGPYPVLSSGLTAGWHDEGPVQGPGFVVGRAANLGRPTWSDNDFWPLNTTLYAADFKGNCPRFLYHLFEFMDLTGFDSGSVQPMLNRNYISQVPVSLPPIGEQRAIAEVLGALDDKIAVNDRINQLAMGFLTTSYEAALSLGSASLRVEEIADFHNRRRVPLSAREREARPGSVPYYGAAGVFGYVDEALFDEVLLLVGEDGSVLTKRGGPVTQYIWGPAWVNNHAHVLTGKGISTELLRFAVSRADVRHLVTGAVQPKISMGKLRTLRLDVPSAEQCAPLEGMLRDQTAALRARSDETRVLSALRDALLPQLMSGKIRVKDAEHVVSEAV
jgi:type I restriction enzyme S subunit